MKKSLLIIVTFLFPLYCAYSETLILERKGTNSIKPVVFDLKQFSKKDSIPKLGFNSVNSKYDKREGVLNIKCTGIGYYPSPIANKSKYLLPNELSSQFTFEMIEYAEEQVSKGKLTGEWQSDFEYKEKSYDRKIKWKAKKDLEYFKVELTILHKNTDAFMIEDESESSDNAGEKNHFIADFLRFKECHLSPDELYEALYYKYSVNNACLYCMRETPYKENEKVYAVLYDLSNQDSFHLSLKGFPLDNRYVIDGFDLTDTEVVISGADQLFFFDRLEGFNFRTSFDIGETFEHVKIYAENIFLFQAIVGGQQTTYTNVWIFNKSANQVTRKIDISDKKDYPFYNLDPRSVLDVNERFIVHSSIIEYNVDIYDTDNNFLYAINRKPLKWICNGDTAKLNQDLITADKYIKENFMANSNALLSGKRTEFSDITNIHLNDSLLFVFWRTPIRSGMTLEDTYVDVYKLMGNKYQVIQTDLLTTNYQNAVDYKPEMLNILGVLTQIDDNYLITATFNPLPIETLKNTSETEYEAQRMQYLLGNDMRLSIFLYELKND